MQVGRGEWGEALSAIRCPLSAVGCRLTVKEVFLDMTSDA